MKLHLVADFNIEILKRFTQGAVGSSALKIDSADILASPINQSLPYLLGLAATATPDDSIFILGFPEQVVAEYMRAKQFEQFSEEKIFDQLNEYIDLVKSVAAKSKLVAALAMQNSFNEPGYGMLDWRPGLGLRQLLAKMNLHFAQEMAAHSNFFLFESEALHHRDSLNYSRKLWYAAKSPFSNQAYKAFSEEILNILNAVTGLSRRIIILDLDNTLWGGIVGENGWQGIRLGGHDHIGEAYKDFQRVLKMMTRRGVQLAIVSKNDESVALDAIDNHPEMILRREDFAAWRINWNDKAANVEALLAEINLGPTSAVFIDDNPVERERVRMSLPDILVPQWPEDPALYVQTLWNLKCFDVPAITDEDRLRTAMYVADRHRKTVKSEVGSIDGWLDRLETQVNVESLNDVNLPRIAQLYNKTNQLNLSSRRLSPREICDWANHDNRRVWSLSVKDKFGDIGLTGVIALEHIGDRVEIIDYILSCRVMGRMVEETMFHLAASWARARSATHLIAKYRPTQRNRPTLDVLNKASLKQAGQNEFTWTCKEPYDKPKFISLSGSAEVLAELRNA